MKSTALSLALILGLALTPAPASAAAAAPAAPAAPPPKDKEKVLKVTAVGRGVSMIEGDGGNIGVFASDEGVLIIDDQFAPLAPKLKAAIARLSPKPVRLVVNTHWHPDHTGGNESFAIDGAAIIAHERARNRLATAQVNRRGETVPPVPAKALPVITFDSDLRLHLGGEEIRVRHVPHAHTDGDSIVLFEKANVIHAGDTLFFNGYPFIDTGTGGDVGGMIGASQFILEQSDDFTRIIPGHGPLGGKAQVLEFHDMLVRVRDRVAKLIAQKRTLNEVLDAKVTAEEDAKWGHGDIAAEIFATSVFRSLVR